jgi:hypothetical protein
VGKLAEAYVEIGSKEGKLDAGLASSHAKLEQFASKANSLLAAVGIGMGGAAIAKFLSDAAEKGSNLGETMSKTKEVFGAATSTVTQMADDMAKQFGAVKTTTLDAAAMFGLVAQGAGLAEQASAKLSTKLVRLADDASSFFNVPLDVALEKIRSGLVGEAEPLRAFGVLLSEAAMKQQALAMGIKPVNGELSEQEKVLARVEIITKGLSKAQGDHARTMGSYANQIRQLKGEWENFQASVGGPLAGGAATIMQSAREKGVLATLDDMFEAMWGGENRFQKQADKNAGVNVGGIKVPAKIDPIVALLNDRAAEAAARNQRQAWDAGKFKGGGFGAFGPMGNLANLMMGPEIDARELALRKKQAPWSAGHVMDTDSFLRAAQEKILSPDNETEKEQLRELVKIREVLSKAKPDRPNGIILRGREQ